MADRDHYIDFLRAFGLLLLVVAHTWAPSGLTAFRVFDVPLMVFISSVCYKPLRGGVVSYLIKRIKRIYYPVFIFLSIFFIGNLIYSLVTGNPAFPKSRILGSYLMLNYPSIGYVWIMRVFLMVAMLLPPLYIISRKMNALITNIVIYGIIIIQYFLVEYVTIIPSTVIRFILDETVLYAIGYLPLVLLGLNIRNFSSKSLYISAAIAGLVTLLIVYTDKFVFDPQSYKYPPQSLYLTYGILCCIILWLFKPIGERFLTWRGFSFLSKNSMWIYLWHIIPVVAITPWHDMPHTWVLRYCIVLGSALLLNYCWSIMAQRFSPHKQRAIQ